MLPSAGAMKTDLFDFDLPGELIAQHPVQPRDAARLLVVDEGLMDRSIRELPEALLDRGAQPATQEPPVPGARLGRPLEG